MEKDIAFFEKNKYQDIRVRVSEYQGNDVIDIRVWTQPPQGSEKVPKERESILMLDFFRS